MMHLFNKMQNIHIKEYNFFSYPEDESQNRAILYVDK